MGNSLRPADAEQLRRAISDHKDWCRTCLAAKACNTLRKLQAALSGGAR